MPGHDTTVASELPCLVVIERCDKMGIIQIDECPTVVLGKNSDCVATRHMKPFDAIHQYLSGFRIVDMSAMLVTQAVTTNLLSIQAFFDGVRSGFDTATECQAYSDEDNRQTNEDYSCCDRTSLPEGYDARTKTDEE